MGDPPPIFDIEFIPGSGWLITRESDGKEFTLQSFFEEFGYYPSRPERELWGAIALQEWEKYDRPKKEVRLGSKRDQCPKCLSLNTYRNGWNKLKSGAIVQRFYCNACDRTFQLPSQS